MVLSKGGESAHRIRSSISLNTEKSMSYYVPNWGSIAGNATIWTGYTINGGQNYGAQFAEAIPQNDTSLMSYNHTVELYQGRYTYYFWIRNETGNPTSWTLSGGSVG
jgi:hypothetical protein